MSLESARHRINAIDREMSRLFVERMEAASEIARDKRERKLPVFDRVRENEVMHGILDETEEKYQMPMKMFYQNIFNISKSYQSMIINEKTSVSREVRESLKNLKYEFPRKAVVACAGIEGSYAKQAVDRLFALPATMYFEGFDNVFHAVETDVCRYGVLPIENSSTGSIGEVYDLMQKHKFYIVRSLKVKISHVLLTKNETEISRIREIISHEQAIGQCSQFLKKHKGIKVTMFGNTALAAKYVSESPRDDIAAISSPECARLYGLYTLDRDIQDNPDNYTRFICIAKNMEIYAGAGKISLMLSLEHRPGALYDMIGKVAGQGINLTKLESRPMSGKPFEFIFYFDMDASVHSETVLRMLDDMKSSTDELTFLGCYSSQE